MSPQENKPCSVTLEDLLRLKRTERPSSEFWSKFESELRAKQLAAIVEKRPWWRAVPPVGFLRYRIPLGVGAIVALSFLSARSYYFPASGDDRSLPSVVEMGSPVAEVSSPSPAIQDPGLATAPVVALRQIPAPAIYAEVESPAAAGAVTPVGSQTSIAVVEDLNSASPIDSGLVAFDHSNSSELSPIAQSIASNLAVAKESYPEIANRFFGMIGFEKRSVAANRQVVDPLARMRIPASLHTERMLASAAPTVAARSGRTGAEFARRLSDERLTEDAISRFGARGNEISLKF